MFELQSDAPRPGIVRVVLHGELDLNSAYQLDRRLLDAEGGRPELILVDLRDVDLLDSSGLARLLAAHRRARRGGWRVVFVKGSQTVQRVFRMTALEHHLEVVPDAEKLFDD